jgi:hypothetical protein
MKFTVAAATAIALATAASTALAGVVITQDVGIKTTSGVRKFVRTIMVQGHKEKIIDDKLQVVVDLDAGQTFAINTANKRYGQDVFPPTGLLAMELNTRGFWIGVKQTPEHHKHSGYDCQNYIGSSTIAHTDVGTIECVASAAPGAKEFTEFQRFKAQKVKGTRFELKGEVPDGIPVSSITNMRIIAFAITGGTTAEQIAKAQADNDKHAIVTTAGVSKIEVKDIPASEFTVPAGFGKTVMPRPSVKQGRPPGPPKHAVPQ